VLAVRETSGLRMWDQMQSRLRVAAKLSRTTEEFATTLQRGMRSEMRKALSSAICDFVDQAGTEHRAVLHMVDREHAYILALAQLATDEKFAKRKAKRDHRRALDLEGEVAEWSDEELATRLDDARRAGDADMVSAIEAELPKRQQEGLF